MGPFCVLACPTPWAILGTEGTLLILRVFNGTVPANDLAKFLDFVRDHALARALSTPGLLSFQPGFRVAGQGLEVVLVSTWEEFSAIATRGRDLDQPIAMPGASQFFNRGHATHYELVAGSTHSLPLAGARMRILRGTLHPNQDSAYFEWSRRERDRLLDEGRLYGAHIGRRLNGHGAETIFVSMGAPGSVDGPTGHAAGRFFVDGWTDDRYEALIAAPNSPMAPALLVADNDRRYLYATPAAAALTGRTVDRLTSLRVDDLAPPELAPLIGQLWTDFLSRGVQEGPFILVGADGSSTEVLYHARANQPWSGVHTSLMAKVSGAGLPDFDSALAAAGILARHAPVPTELN